MLVDPNEAPEGHLAIAWDGSDCRYSCSMRYGRPECALAKCQPSARVDGQSVMFTKKDS